jgi:hypothetical protein
MIANIDLGWPAMGEGRGAVVERRLHHRDSLAGENALASHQMSARKHTLTQLTGIASRETRVSRVPARTLTQAMPPARRAPMVLNPGHGLCSGGKLTGNKAPRGQEAPLRW